MSRSTSMLPFDLWRMGVEAQWVIGLRLMGMAGFWSQSPGETTRMWSEKQRAFGQGMIDAWVATARGAGADAAMAAALRPVSRRVSANSRRLTRGGPAWPRVR